MVSWPPFRRPSVIPYHLAPKSGRLVGIGVTILLHAGLIAVLLQLQPVRSALVDAVPIMVSLISPPPAVEKPREPPRPLPVKPRVRRVEPVPEVPALVTAVTEAPATITAPAPQPLAPLAPVAPAPAAPASIPAVIPPSFNAAYLQNPPPAYPAASRRQGQQGKVVLRVFVNTAGASDKVEVRSSSGFDRLDDAALEAVKRWRFVPARQGETPVAAWVLVPITFTLES